nr:hypothetical protein [Streptococcus sobrinus]
MKKVKELFYSTELRMVISLLMALILLKLLVSDEFLEWPLELKAGLVVLFLLTALLNASYMEKRGKIFNENPNLAQYLSILAFSFLTIYAFFRACVVSEFYQFVFALVVGVISFILTGLLIWSLKYINKGRK